MQKILIILGLGVLLVTLSLAGQGNAQMSGPSNEMGPSSPATVQREIHLLKALNRAGLSSEQLGQFQSLLAELKAAEREPATAQQELRAFLLSWQGNPAEFEAALQPLEAKVERARQAAQTKRRAIVAQLKGLLSYQQGEALFDGLKSQGQGGGMGQMGQQAGAGMMGGMGAGGMASPGEGTSGMMGNASGGMMRMMQSMHSMMQGAADWGQMLAQNLELVERVVQEKLAAM